MVQDKIIQIISDKCNLSILQVRNVLRLLEDGCTIPFISRYRKEATQNLNEVEIQNINEQYVYFNELEKRRTYILSSISQQDKLTDELESKITDCWDKTSLEDLYLPYKPKRRTRAETAREKGLEPLARIIMAQNNDDINYKARKFITEKVIDTDSAISGGLDIIAEWVSENERSRAIVRNLFARNAIYTCKVIKGKETEGEKYANYFAYSEPLKYVSSHRILATRRGEKEGFLRVSIDIDEDLALDRLNKYFIRGDSDTSILVSVAIKDSYKRLIKPSIETEIATSSKILADKEAINTFAQNLRQLLFAAPLGAKRVMGVDPGYRTGCKIVCLDEHGMLLHNDVIYPNPPKSDIKMSAKKIVQLVEAYKIDALSIGNGTASRETSSFFSNLHYDHKIQIYVVSENGASIYSASKIARDEFPDKDVTVRGAVSIGRRLIDPLAELIKIDPKSIGVGQYQHDVDQNELKSALTFTVTSCVNKVGIDLNSASKELLTYISGLGPQLAQNIIEYRSKIGKFSDRQELLSVPRMGAKAFQQSAGFLRIRNGNNPLDSTSVHPECYKIVELMAKDNKVSINDLIKDSSIRSKININDYVTDTTGEFTLKDIMIELDKPGLDPRTKVDVFEFDANIRTINDIEIGMILNGIVTNITQFGAFVDFGIKENGLVHISEMSDKFITSPNEILKLQQHIKVKIINVDKDRKRISLSLKNIES